MAGGGGLGAAGSDGGGGALSLEGGRIDDPSVLSESIPPASWICIQAP